jgi:ATP-dependent helicase/nuclease subunit A
MRGNDWEVVASELERIKNGERNEDLHVRKNKDGELVWEPAKLGDCCILMQTRGKWNKLREELIRREIPYIMIAEKGLFERPEISLIIDILDWLGNPHNKDSLVRILRSPLVGISDRALRYLAYHNFYLDTALKDKGRPKWFDDKVEQLVQGLIDLRDDLRWSREGKKSEMVEKIIRYSQIDTIILSHVDGDQCLANIWYLQDIIASWEEEELLQYSQFIERLKFFRESGTDAYNMAVLADEEDENSVKVATVYATKGLEFPIVFLYFTKLDLRSQWRFISKPRGLYIADYGRFIALDQKRPPGTSFYSWEQFFAPRDTLRTTIRSPYDIFNQEYYTEKWRLYYVAMTRAKDHIYHSISPRHGNTHWIYWFYKLDLLVL